MKSIRFTFRRESDLAAEFIASLQYHSVKFEVERDGDDLVIILK
jgi:hypothetical protein